MTSIKTKYDKEYATQFLQEVEFLSSVGIRYTFVKFNEGISTYKYAKTQELFEALVLFYMQRLTKERLICERQILEKSSARNLESSLS